MFGAETSQYVKSLTLLVNVTRTTIMDRLYFKLLENGLITDAGLI